MKRYRLCLFVALLGFALAPSLARADNAFLSQFHTVSQVASTVPANGDVNPYGVAVVPRSIGTETRGNVLVSNFNNSGNLQGTGTTIVQVSPYGTTSLFAQINPSSFTCPGGVGLTTALVILSRGWVVVGSLPTTDGMVAFLRRAACGQNASRGTEDKRGSPSQFEWTGSFQLLRRPGGRSGDQTDPVVD